MAAAWAGARLFWPPPGHNTHTLMYPLVEAAGSYNTLEPFHPLYVPLLGLVRRLWEAAGAAGPALPAFQAVSLLAGAGNILLMHRLVRRVAGADAALGAALILAVSANLWSWSLQTTSYTLSTFCLLAMADRLLARESLDVRDAAWTGLWAGLAAGFDVAAGAGALVSAYELSRRRARPASPAAVWPAFAIACTAPAALGLALLAGRLDALGWPFPPTLAGFLGSLPRDIAPLWRSWDFPGQIRAWAASEAPLDLPFWAAAGAVVWSRPSSARWDEAALWRLGAGLWVCVTSFFFLNDPHNRFLYAGTLLLPALFAARRGLRWCAAAAAILAAWHAAVPPRYAPEGNPGFEEARYLGERLGPRDAIVALSEPDWVFAYAWGARSAVLRPGPELERRLDAVLCSGGRAVLAADALFRSSLRPPEALEAEARALLRRLLRRYRLEPAWVSPCGQHYQPLLPRRCPRM